MTIFKSLATAVASIALFALRIVSEAFKAGANDIAALIAQDPLAILAVTALVVAAAFLIDYLIESVVRLRSKR